jgi:hypothetical protein
VAIFLLKGIGNRPDYLLEADNQATQYLKILLTATPLTIKTNRQETNNPEKMSLYYKNASSSAKKISIGKLLTDKSAALANTRVDNQTNHSELGAFANIAAL